MEINTNNNGREEITFTAELVSQSSYSDTELGNYESTMELFRDDNGVPSMIEWDVPELEETEHIGLEIEGNDVVGYDGIWSLPQQAIDFLEKLGYDCSEVKND